MQALYIMICLIVASAGCTRFYPVLDFTVSENAVQELVGKVDCGALRGQRISFAVQALDVMATGMEYSWDKRAMETVQYAEDLERAFDRAFRRTVQVQCGALPVAIGNPADMHVDISLLKYSSAAQLKKDVGEFSSSTIHQADTRTLEVEYASTLQATAKVAGNSFRYDNSIALTLASTLTKSEQVFWEKRNAVHAMNERTGVSAIGEIYAAIMHDSDDISAHASSDRGEASYASLSVSSLKEPVAVGAEGKLTFGTLSGYVWDFYWDRSVKRQSRVQMADMLISPRGNMRWLLHDFVKQTLEQLSSRALAAAKQ